MSIHLNGTEMLDQKAYWVGFNHIKGIGSVRLRRLLDFFCDLSVAWNAPLDGLLAAGLPEKIAQQVIQNRNNINLESLFEGIVGKGIEVLIQQDDAYPSRLREVDQPPPVLYVKGELTLEDQWSVAIVGTRRMTGYGKQVTTELAAFLAGHGICVVSGLARGIDTVAHASAIHAGGRTIAVLGCGVDVIYPPENRHLYEQITQQGAIISDYAPGTAPEGINFPPRNRIIAGLSAATVVIEAGKSSGALITSTFAAEQGREVFAVPGNIYAPQSKGSNFLIQQGARPLLDFDELLETLQYGNAKQQQTARKLIPESDVEAKLLQVLCDQPMHVDEIHIQSDLPMSVVSATLTILELKGMVYQTGKMHYSVVRERLTD